MSDSGEPKNKFNKRDLLKLGFTAIGFGIGGSVVGPKIISQLEASRASQEAKAFEEELKSNSSLDGDQKLDLMIKLHKEQQILGWNNLIDEGLPPETFKSACRITVFDLTLSEGSASILSLKRNGKKYRVIPTAGHILNIITENCLGVGLYRHEEMGEKTKNGLKRNQFGFTYTLKQGDFNTEEDFGIIVIEEDVAISTGISDVYPWEEVASAEDILFDSLPKNTEGLYAVGFPGVLGVAPLACMNASVKSFEQSKDRKNLTIDNWLIYGGNSGTLVYWKHGLNKAKIVGTVYAHFDVLTTSSDNPNRIFADNSNVFPISTLGKQRFNAMIDDAITDLESMKV